AASSLFAQSLSSLTSNNTSACSAAGSPGYCQAGFTAMVDATRNNMIFNPPPVNISKESAGSLLYGGNNTLILVHYQPWFCMNVGSTATGTGTSCHGHVQVGYNSNDANTVAGQMDDILSRGINGVFIDWYGTGHALENGTTQKIQQNLDARCN